MTALSAALQSAGYTPSTDTDVLSMPEPTSEADTRPWKLVTHYYPDSDAICCLWAAAKFIAKDAEHTLCFVPAGDKLPADDAEGYRVLEMDTGKGELDQHEKRLKRASSFALFCEKYGLSDDPGIVPILEMSRKADNVEDMSRTELHFVFRGLAYHYTDKNKEVDWQAVCDYAFIALDILYSQGRQRAKSTQELSSIMHRYELPNGVVLATVWWRPALRDAAFESGADVVMFTQNIDRKANLFYVGIQTNRKSRVTLETVISGIRLAEAQKREVETAGHDLRAIGIDPHFGGWFMHDSLKLVACGTRGHPLEGDEFTKLTPQEILGVLRERLGKLPVKK